MVSRRPLGVGLMLLAAGMACDLSFGTLTIGKYSCALDSGLPRRLLMPALYFAIKLCSVSIVGTCSHGP